MSLVTNKCLRFVLSEATKSRLIILATQKPPHSLQVARRFSNRLVRQSVLIEQRRFQSTQPGQKSNFAGNVAKYAASIIVGIGAGLFTGYWLVLNQSPNVDKPEQFEPNKHIEGKNPKYKDFPLSLHLYEYISCPYCSQIRAYLDYFGFPYTRTEVNPYSKEEIATFTRARQLPILVLENPETKERWHLTNSTAILSALESLRNDQHPADFAEILRHYLPILKGKSLHTTVNPFKYHVTNSELNSVEWRRWINNTAIVAFRANSMRTWPELLETVNWFAEKSEWRSRFNPVKLFYVYCRNILKTNSFYPKLSSELNENLSLRENLDSVLKKWEDGLGEDEFIGGKTGPNLADLSLFGVTSAFEGCSFFKDTVMQRPKFRAWYERMKLTVAEGFKENTETTVEVVPQIEEQKPVESEPQEPQHEEKPVEPPAATNKDTDELSPSMILRILTTNYLIHVAAFTYAAWNNK